MSPTLLRQHAPSAETSGYHSPGLARIRPRQCPRTPGRDPGNAVDRSRASADASFLIGMCR
jgi:hypothetical protein